MMEIMELITTSSSQIFGALFGFQIVMIIIYRYNGCKRW